MLEFGTHPMKPRDVKICTYAMCKNEIQFVDKWLENIWNNGQGSDYITVLDTGSTDGTYERLLQKSQDLGIPDGHFILEQKIIEPWRFDVARNESMKLIPDKSLIDVCFSIDLDEIVDEKFWDDLRQMVYKHPMFMRIYYKYAWSHDANGNPEWTFWYDKVHSPVGWEWVYPVHEVLTCNCWSEYDGVIHYLNKDIIYVHHYPDNTRARSSYLPLLKIRAEEWPNDLTGRYYLVREYYYYRMWEELKDECYKVLQIPDKEHQDNSGTMIVAAVMCLYGFALYNCGDADSAEKIYRETINKYPTWKEGYMLLAQLLAYTNMPKECLGLLDVMDNNVIPLEIWTIHPWVNSQWKRNQIIADAYTWQGKWEEAWEIISSVRNTISPFDEWSAVTHNFYNDYDFIKDHIESQTENNPNKNNTEIMKNYSWVTLLYDNNYFLAEVTLVNSIREYNSKYPISCLITPNIRHDYQKILQDMEVNLIFISQYISPQHQYYLENSPEVYKIRQQKTHWADGLTKLNIFNLTQFDKIVYIDNDVLLVDNMDALFDYPHMSACKDICGHADNFCTGMLVIEPSEKEFNELLAFANEKLQDINSTTPWSDSSILQLKYSDWTNYPEKCISSKYNWWFNFASELSMEDNIYSWHYVLEKPWDYPMSFYEKYKTSYPISYKIMIQYIQKLDETNEMLREKYDINTNWKPIVVSTDEIEITIVIPYHHESPIVLNRLLSSINNQVGYDFSKAEILICSSDGKDNSFDTSLYDRIQSRIKFISIQRNYSGPGQSKQIGLDNARGKYIFFWDCDDSLYAIDTLYKIMNKVHTLNDYSWDIMLFDYIDEVYGKVYYQLYDTYHVNGWVQWSHLYQTEFLRSHNLYFKPDIKINEDIYFHSSCILAGARFLTLPILVYAHCMMPDSTGNNTVYTPQRLEDNFKVAGDLMNRFNSINPLVCNKIVTGCYVEAFHSVYKFTNQFQTFTQEDKDWAVSRLLQYFDAYGISNINDVDIASKEDIDFVYSVYQNRRLP